MKIPGFIAEASLYKTKGQYRTVASYTIPEIRVALQWCPDKRKCNSACYYCEAFGKQCGICDECKDCEPELPGDNGGESPPPKQYPTKPVCREEYERRCLPPPFNWFCWNECTRTCCYYQSPDQRFCGVEPC
ncbi:MAG: hypothetical protein DWB56_14560 [Candidatus Jettenia sp.]|uniref:Uncharacterized protein n=1 Tax=Candidatus Jettenia caeni TaxID=247490 RepID=I3IPD9_9BACT|nr:hypothetical protein [Candidatus Jettenia sp. AMX1]MBC6930154.1 hypothetical protein [Candidatus Jettenia sp.]NUN22435.1 hypothetical protein [Candidatus Jettenia caeni]KAA0248601.1 MAG: hypothetical protein EDM77_11925 [Candidatus Jettenia sp. AMX1]MCE7881561.1 hypothetical protein [Candidatus Jettenia sp. AMX1]MCQ3927724.1 hypothetical protein [Candidatus Jettenia sp.]